MKKEPLSKRLRTLRKAYGYTQEYVASHLDVVRQTYSNYEAGRRSPDPGTLCKIADLYHVTSDELLRDAFPGSEYTLADESAAYIPDYELHGKDLEDYLAYMNNPRSAGRISSLNQRERDMIYYFSKIPDTEKEDLLTYMKIRAVRSRFKK